MYARVWRAVILHGKVDEFAAAIKSIIPLLRKLPGFRGIIVLRTGPGEELEATIISMWATIDDLRNSEPTVFQEAVGHMLSTCEPHPLMREEEVVISDFEAGSPDDTVTNLQV
jgi:heme-degrading monooxygenase HmoA